MEKNFNQQVKSPSDLYYDFFCLLHLPVSCSVNASIGEEFELLSCPVTYDLEIMDDLKVRTKEYFDSVSN